MKRTVLVFGLISGVIVAAMVAVSAPLAANGQIAFELAEVIGYSSMVVAFLLVFFGIRSYRDNVGGGSITFGKAFQVGILITLVSCSIYVATWLVVYYNFIPDFMDRYAEGMIARADDKAAVTAQMAKFKEWYANPLLVIALTYMEMFPLGLVLSLVSAAILRRRRPDGAQAVAALA